MKRSRSGQCLSDFIAAGKRPRNQIATISGLTNTYIRNLERGEIANVPRERLIALGVALNLELSEIESLLVAFDRARLTLDDVPVFIETAKRATLSEAVLPVRDLAAYELILLSMERVPGHQIIVSDRPTNSLMVEGHRTYSDRNVMFRHAIFGTLVEAIGAARRDNFLHLLRQHRIDHYLCRRCLEGYLSGAADPTEHQWRLRHVAALLEVVGTQENFHLMLTDTCVNLNFTLKLTAGGQGNDKLSYSARAPHEARRGSRGQMIGFITENPTLCACFSDDLSRIADTVVPSLADRRGQIAFLQSLLAPVGGAAPVADDHQPE